MRFLAVLSFCLLAFPLSSFAAPPTCSVVSEGVIVYNKDHKVMQYCDGIQWIGMSGSSAGSIDTLSSLSCANNEIAKWNGTAWVCAPDASGMSSLPALTSASIWVGNASNAATAVAMSGDATMSNAGLLTIGSNAVGSAEITNASVALADLSASGAPSTTTYLRGDNTWATLPAGADNLGNHIATQTIVSDTTNTDDLGTTAVRWKDGWFAGNVTAGTFVGSGASLTALNATNLSSGTVAAGRLPAFTGDVTVAAGTTVTVLATDAVTTAEILDGTVTAADTAIVGTLTEGKWCTVSSGKIVCTSEAPSSGGGGIGGMQVFTTSGTFAVPTGVTKVKASVVGGGSGGRPGGTTGYPATPYVGPSGGAGGTAIGIITVTAGANMTVTVGAAGAGLSASGGSGGGTSTFSTLTGAGGNTPGNGGNGATGTGGSGSGGIWNFTGAAGGEAKLPISGTDYGNGGSGKSGPGGSGYAGGGGVVIIEW